MLVTDAVARVLDGARLPALVVTEEAVELDAATATVIAPGEAKPEGHFRTVLLVARDADDLRRTVARLAPAGWARMVAVVVGDTDRVVTLRPHPAWPALAAVEAAVETTAETTVARTRLEFTERLEALPVLRALAGSHAGHGGLRVTRPGEPVDDPAAKHPPDVAVDPPAPPVVSEVTGRAPVTVHTSDPDPLDETVYHPIGWTPTWSRPVVDPDPATRLSPSLVRDLRDAQGVRLAPGTDQRVVAGLAMSGIPLLGATGSMPADPTGAEVSLVDVAVLEDPHRREDQSIRQRRAALARHSTIAARSRLAATAGVRSASYPSVSLVLTVRRPDQLAHALARVAHQRRTLPGAEVELMLVAHGFTPDPSSVTAALEPSGTSVTIVPATTDTLFGSAHGAGGDLVLTVDADHRIGPDLVTDLLLARRYSGADVVAAPLPSSATTEAYGHDATGGPLLRDRGLRSPRDPGLLGYRIHDRWEVR